MRARHMSERHGDYTKADYLLSHPRLSPEEQELCYLNLMKGDAQSMEMQMYLSKRLTRDKSETGPYEELPHKFLREQCEFSDATNSFLNRYRQRLTPRNNHNGSETFYIPLHGITNRSLQDDDGTGCKFFKTTMEVTVPKGAHNLDECTFKRGPRQPESEQEYLHGINEELKGASDLAPHQGPLCFFTHGAFTGAGVSDNDAVRLAMLTGVPTVNVDWRSTQGAWFTLPLRYPVDYAGAVTQERTFESKLDDTFAFIGENHGAMIGFSRGTGFNATYMQHRFAHRNEDTPINSDVLAHADLQTKEFRVREDGLNPIVSASKNTIVLGNPHDCALKVGRWRISGDRVGDAKPGDIKAVTAAGGKYVIDDYQRRGGNLQHYIDYKVIAKMIRTMVLAPAANDR